MTVLICPSCGRENREGKYCSVCGCYLPRLFTEEREPQPIERRIGGVVGRPTNTDALLFSDVARVEAMYRIAMADWDDHLRAGVPESRTGGGLPEWEPVLTRGLSGERVSDGEDCCLIHAPIQPCNH